jgi:hypothetical protein
MSPTVYSRPRVWERASRAASWAPCLRPPSRHSRGVRCAIGAGSHPICAPRSGSSAPAAPRPPGRPSRSGPRSRRASPWSWCWRRARPPSKRVTPFGSPRTGRTLMDRPLPRRKWSGPARISRSRGSARTGQWWARRLEPRRSPPSGTEGQGPRRSPCSATSRSRGPARTWQSPRWGLLHGRRPGAEVHESRVQRRLRVDRSYAKGAAKGSG